VLSPAIFIDFSALHTAPESISDRHGSAIRARSTTPAGSERARASRSKAVLCSWFPGSAGSQVPYA
jgi:hypothetical protein